MAEELPPLVASIIGDASQLFSVLDDVEARLLAFARQDFTAKIGADDAGLVKTVAEAESMLDAIGNQTATPNIDGNDTGLEAAIARAEIAIAALAKEAVNLPIDGDPNPFLEVVAELHAMVEEPVDIPIDATGLKSIMAQILATRGAMAALKTDSILASTAITEADLMSVDAVNSAVRDAQVARVGAQALVDGALTRIASSGGGGGGAGGAGGSGGGGSFWGSFLANSAPKGGLLGLGTGVWPKIPVAGFGTLGSMAGLGAESILGLGAGVLGFAAHGALGGAALGLTSAAVTGVGMGTDFAGIGQATGDIKQYGQLQQNLAQTAAVYGKSSTEYAAAMYAYQQWSSTLSKGYVQAVAAASGTETAFKAMFDKVTGAAATSGANIVNGLMKTAMTFLPTIGKFAAENMGIIQKALVPLEAWLSGPGLAAFNKIEQVFTDHLPTAMHAFDQAVELVIKTIAHFAPETGGLVNYLDKLFTKLNGPGFEKFIGEVQRAIDAFRVWEQFGKAVFTMIDELFKNDAKTGEAFVQTLTHLINEFNRWAKTVEGGDKLHDYMEAHKQEVIQLVDLFGKLISIMGTVHLTVGPALMEIVGDLLKFVNLLLEIPGVNKILSYVIAFELLARHISILGPVMNAFNNSLKNIALDGLHLLGSGIAMLGGPFSTLGNWMKGIGVTGPSSMDEAAAAMKTATAEMSASAAQIADAFSTVSGAASDAALSVERSSGAMDAAMATTAGDAEISAAKVDTALGTEGLAGDLGGAGLAAGGAEAGSAGFLAKLLGKGGAAAGEEEGAGGIAALLAKGSLGGGLAGLVGVQLYNGLLEKRTAGLIGKNAAGAIGDIGTGAALGAGIGGLPGAGIGAALGLLYAERGAAAKLLTGGPKGSPTGSGAFPHATPGAVWGSGGVTPTAHPAGYNPKFPFAGNGPGTAYTAPHQTQSQSLLAKDSTLQKQLAAIQVLEFNANEAKAKDGANSSAYKAALKALNSTEQKYFPTLGKDVSLKGVDNKIALMKGNIVELTNTAKAAQPYILQLDAIKTTLGAQKSQLDTLIKGGASKDAIDQVRSEVQKTETHMDAVKAVVQDGANATHQIKSDTTQLNKLQNIQSIMQKVNTDTTRLHSDLTPLTTGVTISKLPPQAMKASGTIRLNIS